VKFEVWLVSCFLYFQHNTSGRVNANNTKPIR
jgi:hypothetical protein